MHAIHSAKLATLGQMAASIAHEINNPLAVIAAAAYVIAEHTQGEEALVTEAVADARAAVARTATIVHGLRRFARFDSEEPPEPVAVASIKRTRWPSAGRASSPTASRS